jgi:hypothetical protein
VRGAKRFDFNWLQFRLSWIFQQHFCVNYTHYILLLSKLFIYPTPKISGGVFCRPLDWVVSQPVIHNIKDLFG